MLYLIFATVLFISFIFFIKGMSSSQPQKVKKIYKYTLLSLGIVLILILLKVGMPLIAILLGGAMAAVPNIRRIVSLLYAVKFITGFLPKKQEKMSAEQAREILNVKEEASEKEVSDAYKYLMKKNHPDAGGSKYFANQLNDARDTLLKK